MNTTLTDQNLAILASNGSIIVVQYLTDQTLASRALNRSAIINVIGIYKSLDP